MKFSQRIGKKPIRSVLQVEEIDKTLEVKLWNFIVQHFFDTYDDNDFYSDTKRAKICKTIWVSFFNNLIDDIPRYSNTGAIVAASIITYCKEWFFKSIWYEKYDFLEYLVYLTNENFKPIFADILNFTLKSELAGYRLINFQIVQITSNEEILEIEEAINESKSNAIRTHLELALSHLSNKQKPDYRNSIKESISAVESYCVLLTGDPKATLGKALAIIEKQYSLHGALKTAYTALYGYTSDEGGIRHSLLENTVDISFADAKYMLVICSAFINYMNSKIK
ncbi:hypothetical protein I6I98_08875 [Sphingobacterium multivorum]|uniref:HEPN AbiJ-N-terminal domain-containing protein n=1 Tax=Sphingobacterium multivorum TaxID=28454 RepID=A0ABX7CUF6_SPHMU|nr:hypothetical protein [Sphingobacterium multivorum]QQT55348.1 hypothetical protein I6I98_08875 [Sphingobacterium multivorum]